ncbi:hypothetical protein SADUNF_Sadunf17G0076300 [Salix dunnii]|uniref:Uncharacterized protein n=1 Tax=Salix dunnii TaxID=1413687 RepID=A0A835J521_9ROSI|nr:hypothetical protein SADUNF_Sadunf17G0076300 [Salix dunnii]
MPASKNQVKFKQDMVLEDCKAEGVPLQSLLVNFSVNSFSVPNNTTRNGIFVNCSQIMRKSNLAEDGKRWTVVADTASLVGKESRKSLQLLQGLKGTHLVITKMVFACIAAAVILRVFVHVVVVVAKVADVVLSKSQFRCKMIQFQKRIIVSLRDTLLSSDGQIAADISISAANRSFAAGLSNFGSKSQFRCATQHSTTKVKSLQKFQFQQRIADSLQTDPVSPATHSFTS